MDLKLFATVFTTIFLAELGDKTQIATLLYASDRAQSRWTIFLGSAAALALASALAVGGGSLLAQWVSPRAMRMAGGLGFIVVGIWVLVSGEG